MNSKFLTILSNVLILIGLVVILYSVFVIEQRKNKKIEESYKAIAQLSVAIITYNNEPKTVTALAGEIMRYTNIDDIKKEDFAVYVRR